MAERKENAIYFYIRRMFLITQFLATEALGKKTFADRR